MRWGDEVGDELGMRWGMRGAGTGWGDEVGGRGGMRWVRWDDVGKGGDLP